MPRPKLPAGPGRPRKPAAERLVASSFKLAPEVDGLLTTLADVGFGGNRTAALTTAIRLQAAGLDPTYRTPDGRRRRPRDPDRVPPRRRDPPGGS